MPKKRNGPPQGPPASPPPEQKPGRQPLPNIAREITSTAFPWESLDAYLKENYSQHRSETGQVLQHIETQDPVLLDAIRALGNESLKYSVPNQNNTGEQHPPNGNAVFIGAISAYTFLLTEARKNGKDLPSFTKNGTQPEFSIKRSDYETIEKDIEAKYPELAKQIRMNMVLLRWMEWDQNPGDNVPGPTIPLLGVGAFNCYAALEKLGEGQPS